MNKYLTKEFADRFKRYDILIFLIACLVKVSLTQLFLVMDGDRMLQMNAAINLAKGNGYTVLQSTFENLNKVNYTYLLEWPPLYSFCLVPFLWLTGFNELMTFSIADSILVIFYMFSIRILLKYFQLPLLLIWVLYFFKAAEFNSAIYDTFPSDVPAAGAIFMAIYFLMRYINEEKVKLLVYSGIFTAISFLFRYQYIIAISAFPVILAWHGLQTKKSKFTINGVLLLAGIYLVVGLDLLNNRLQTGKLTYSYIQEYGFYPENILHLIPLFWSSFTDVHFLCLQINNKVGLNYHVIKEIFKYSSWMFIGWFLWRWLKRLSKKSVITGATHIDQFLTIGGIFSLLLTLTLSALSIRQVMYDWTYVLEDRYFMVVLFVILVAITRLLFHPGRSTNRVISSLRIAYFLAALLLSAHAIWMINRYLKIPKTEYSFAAQDAEPIYNCIDKIISKWNDSRDFIFISEDYGMMHFALSRGARLFRYPSEFLSDPTPHITRPSRVVFILNTSSVKEYSIFLKRNKFKPVAEINGNTICVKE